VAVLTAFRPSRFEGYALTLGISHVFDKPLPFDQIMELVSVLHLKAKETG